MKEQLTVDISLFATLIIEFIFIGTYLEWLKESVISNHFQACREEIRTAVISFLIYIARCPEKVLWR